MFNFLPTFLALQSSRRALRNSNKESEVPLRKGEIIFLNIIIGILIVMTIAMIGVVIMYIS